MCLLVEYSRSQRNKFLLTFQNLNEARRAVCLCAWCFEKRSINSKSFVNCPLINQVWEAPYQFSNAVCSFVTKKSTKLTVLVTVQAFLKCGCSTIFETFLDNFRAELMSTNYVFTADPRKLTHGFHFFSPVILGPMSWAEKENKR